MTTWLRGRWLPLAVLVAAVAALIASLVWVAGGGDGHHGPRGPRTMAGVVSPEGPVRTLADADRAAGRFAGRWGLHVGEVMEFSNGYYAVLLGPDGKGATEVLVDRGGTVRPEPGPAMMWNTAYGMMPAAGTGTPVIGADRAVRIADQWLREHRPALHAAEPEAFPGYYTLHTLRGHRITGMLSVNSRTGEVWYHTWHGRFLGMQDHPGRG
ncbi:hypothetical protein [Streptomyces sp. NPDC007264]|uniref:hypothetical protein n=1 Tax=Streptomyces sp. NPDC007264 TaxID=3364777 RepID=UPI0036DF7EAB